MVVADQINDGLETTRRLAAPVLSDVTEQTMLNLVPLAGPRREVADPNLQFGLVDELL